jgi:hypothetical protein
VSDPRDFSVEDEQQIYREFAEFEARRNSYRNAASADLANIVDRLVRNAPQVEPGVALAAAQAVRGGQMTYDDAVNTLQSTVRRQVEIAEPQEQPGQSIFGRFTEAVQEKFKSGVKWGVAGLEFVPQVVTNFGSRLYNNLGSPGDSGKYVGPKTDLFEGLVASTDIGALASGVSSGNGYFIGEAALEQQQRAVRDYRGTIDGEAWTFGRGFAVSMSQPGSREYNILSGLVDAVAAIAIPSVPFAKAASSVATQAADLAGLRRVSGLTNFATPYIDRTKVSSWLDTSSGRAVRDRIVKVETMDEAQQLFPKADAAWWYEVTEAKTADDVNNLLRRNLGLDRQGLNRVDDLKVGMFDDARRKVSLKNKFSGRYSAIVPGEEFVVDATDMRDLTKTVRNADAYMRTVRVDAKDRDKVLKALTKGLIDDDRAGVRTALHSLQKFVVDSVVETRGPLARTNNRELVETMFAKFREDIEEYVNYGFIDEAADPAEVDGLRYSVSGTAPGEVEIRTGGNLKLDTAHLETEAKKFSTYFPDPRKLRRITSRTSFLWTKSAQNPELYGDARAFVSALDWIQNQVWRPMTLVTGGYMFRNMLESIMRQTTAQGVASGPLHPMQWIQSMVGYKFIGDIEGNRWMGEAGRMARQGNREFFEATGAKIRELQDPVYMHQRALRSGRFAIVKNNNKVDYAKGVATELRLLAGDEVARRIARGQTAKQIVEEYLTKAEGERYVKRLQSRWTNRTIREQSGEEVRGTVRFLDKDGYDVDNLYAYVQSVEKRLNLKTGGNDTLRRIVANEDGLGRFVTSDGKDAFAFKQLQANTNAWDEYENFDYTQQFLDEIKRIAELPDSNLPEFVKIAPPLQEQMVGGKSKFQWFDKTLNHFFGSVFGKKEAFLNRSPVFRQYYYQKINDLVRANEVSQEALIQMYEGIAEGGSRYFREKVTMLEQLKPNAAGRYEWDGVRISQRQYEKLLKEAKKDADKAAGRVRVDTTQGYSVYEIVDDAWAARYVGSEELWQRIKDAKAGRYTVPKNSRLAQLEAIQPNANGRYLVDGRELNKRDYTRLLIDAGGLSPDQLSFAAKAFAMEETKRVFYNAAEVNNFTDIMRIVIPFGPAWGEAMRFYGKEVLTKPNRAKNLAVSVQGIRDADPDGDGKGFFYTDPVTGEMMFNYPFSPEMVPIIGAIGGAIGAETLFGAGRRAGPIAAAGGLFGGLLGAGAKNIVEDRLGDAEFRLQAPAQSLSQSFQVLPGFGPVVQMSAGKLLGDKPRYDDVVALISPFGSYEDPLSSLVPSWAQKFAAAVTADPETDRMFADLYIDSYRAIYASGKYDNTNAEQMEELRLRARDTARTLLMLRSIGQFVGPARPEPELLVPTKFEGELTVKDVDMVVKNNIPSSVLAAVFRQMQDEDYDNAVINFLQTFGDSTMLYMPGMTQNKVQGLQATDLFGDWERENGAVRRAFPLVYGYFATPGGEFELQTYLRQIRGGAREKINDPALLQADAEAVVGKALYMNAVRQLGTDLSRESKAELRQYRTELENILPGFEFQPLNINERDQIREQVLDAGRSSFLEGNSIARAVATYADYRDRAVAEAITRNNGIDTGSLLTRTENADLRQWLRTIGDTLTQRTPEFERVWTRVLFDEVDI